MEYILKPSEFFLGQIDDLSEETNQLIEEKLRFVKRNPFRYKRIYGFGLFLFRIRFGDKKKEKRIIYLVDKPYVKILCVLDRDKEYKDLKDYLKRLKYGDFIRNI